MEKKKEEISITELSTAVFLGLAAVVSAWVGYKATTFSSSMSTQYSMAGRYHREAARLDNRLGQEAIIDENAFERWKSSALRPAAAVAIERRFSPHFRKAFAEWEAIGRPEDETPLDLPAYSQPIGNEENLDDKAAQATGLAEKANALHDKFIMLEIGTALASFFLGLSSLGKKTVLRNLYVGAGALVLAGVFVTALVWSIQN